MRSSATSGRLLSTSTSTRTRRRAASSAMRSGLGNDARPNVVESVRVSTECLNRARTRLTTSAAALASRIMRSTVFCARSIFGGSAESQRWQACELATIGGQRLVHFVRDRGGKLGQACRLARMRKFLLRQTQLFLRPNLTVDVQADDVPLHNRAVGVAHRLRRAFQPSDTRPSKRRWRCFRA